MTGHITKVFEKVFIFVGELIMSPLGSLLACTNLKHGT